jgi:peroxiredoxin Q/BCP
MAPLNEGDLAPDFELLRDGGAKVTLSALRGRPVVVYFYPKDDTAGCTTQAVDFSRELDAFRRLGADIIGISPDGVKAHDKFRAKHGLSLILAADEERRAITAYDVWREKKMYGRTYMGVERSTFLIDSDGRIARIWRAVKVPGHVGEVLAALKNVR